jgi:hypothetical protein
MKDANSKKKPNAAAHHQSVPQPPRRLDEDPDRHLIRLQLVKPPQERTHFLRIPLANGGSCL